MFTKLFPSRSRGLSLSAFVLLTIPILTAQAAQLPVDLGSAADYAILAKSGISTVPSSVIRGNIGVSPIDSTAITGFSLILDSTTQFATSPQIIGKAYAANYSSPTPSRLTTAVSDMATAYTDAAGRPTPDFTELGAGDISGLTLAPGLYKWGTGLNILSDATICGGPNDVWIFQVAGNITMASDISIILAGGAQAKNIFWQVAGGVGVNIGTDSHFEGIILAQAGINFNTGASVNGRLLSQTAVTLKSNPVTAPSLTIDPPHFGPTSRAANGVVTLTLTNTPNVEITLQHSEDLENWTLLSRPTPIVSPLITTDNTASGRPMRFYRAFYR